MTAAVAPTRAQQWSMWAIPAGLFLIAFFHRAAPGVVAKELMQAFGATGTIVGLLSATYFYGYAALMIPAGVLIDAYGVRRVVAAGGALMGAGSIAMALAPGQVVLFSGRLAVGVGAAVTFVGALKIAANWFPPARFGTISALTAAVGLLGSLVATVPLAVLMGVVGWRGAFAVVGAVTAANALVCWAFVREAPGSGRRFAGSSAGLRPVVAGTVQVLANLHTWPPFLAFFCLYSAMGNLMLWSVPYLRDVYGLSTSRAALYATATSLALLVAGPLTGFVSDRVVRRRKLPYTVLTGVLFLVWVGFIATLGTLPLGGVYVVFFAMGVFGGAFVLTWPIGREVNPPHLAGVAVAVVNLGGFLGAALTQAPLGAMLDARWAGVIADGARAYPVAAYRAAFVVCAVFVLASMAVTLLVRETYGENIYEKLRGPAALAERRA